MPATYKFTGVPKTFTTREAALTFLLNSPGYVKRRQKYLATYWPGLLADVKGRTAPKGRAGITQVGEQQTLRRRSAKLRGVDQTSVLDKIAAAAEQGGTAAGKWAVDQTRQTIGAGMAGGKPTNRLSSVPAPVQRASKAAETVVPSPHTIEGIGDQTLGKGLTNLAQGQGPKNWQDVAGLGVGVAGILPIGRGVKGAAALKAAFKGEKAAATAADAAKVAKAAGKLPEPSYPGLGAGPKTLNETVQDALKGAPEAIAEQNKVYSQERAIRINKGLAAYDQAGGGAEGARALFGELKGELPKISWGGFSEFTPETADQMIRHIAEKSDLRGYEIPRAMKGMLRMMEGRPPQENQRLLLERVFGKENIDSITDPANAGVLQFIHKHALEVWNTPRTLLASFDLSAPFRQGLVAGARHPVIFAKNVKPMVRAWGSEEYARQVMDDIYSSPNLTRYFKAKLALTDAAGPTALREEQFPPGLLDKTWGVKNSARAYSTFLDGQRAKVFDRLIDVAERDSAVSKLLGPKLSHVLGFSVKNVDDPEFLDALGRYINVATGRGKLPWKTAEKAAPFLNSFLFSPRLMASRIAILNPFYYVNLYRQSPFVARQAVQALISTLGGISAMLYLASNIPGVKVGTNPLSADFGKIRIGNTRIDIAGGLQQYLVLYSRLIAGKSVSSTTGKTQNLKGGYGDSSRLDVLTRFLEGKFAPSAGMIRDALEGQTFIGDPLTPQGMAYNNLVPLNVQGAIEGYKNQDASIPWGAAAGVLGSVGFGVNTYPDKKTPTKYGRSSTRSNPFEADSGSNPFESNNSTYNPFEP